eukprot:Skav203270  [mRNA]  locus=scaffold2987:109856:110293:+ [translate_table: standard]
MDPKMPPVTAVPMDGSASARRRQSAAAFLLLDEEPLEASDLIFAQSPGETVVESRAKNLATSFSGHGGEHGSVLSDVQMLFSDPYKITEASVWAKLMTDIAVTANFGALILTFLGAAYHAYGYVQLRNAQKQASRSQGGGHGHQS